MNVKYKTKKVTEVTIFDKLNAARVEAEEADEEIGEIELTYDEAVEFFNRTRLLEAEHDLEESFPDFNGFIKMLNGVGGQSFTFNTMLLTMETF